MKILNRNRTKRWGLSLLLVTFLCAAARPDLDPKLLTAVNKNDAAGAEFFLERGANPDTKDSNGISVLIHASVRGNLPVVATLLRHRATVDLPGPGGCTPLIWAARNNQVNVVRSLLRAGANINHRDQGGLTALMRAAWNGQTATAKLLLEEGADRYLADNWGHVAAVYALSEDNHAMAALILGTDDLEDLLERREILLQEFAKIPRTPCGEPSKAAAK